tara:strand:- start:768 stop:1022 length:255 start_codon:yes stop_codon:yes gene_type:complete
MVEIIIYIIIFLILVFVLSIAVKAITRGVEAKQLNKDDKYSEHKNENQNQNLQVINQIKELKDLHEKGVLNDNEFEKAKEKVLK